MNLDDIYEEYIGSSAELTEKQKLYLEKISTNFFEDASEILERKILSWKDIKNSDTKKLFNKLESKCKIDKETVKKIAKISIADIEKKCNRKIKTREDITISDMKKIFSENKFGLFSIDRPIHIELNYEYGKQESELCDEGYMYYLRFFNLMMIDIDNKNLDDIKKLLLEFGETFRIYETYKGYHIFITSRKIPYNSDMVPEIMAYLKCDSYYILFCQKNGYKIRLNKKKDRGETFISKYLETIGTKDELHENVELMMIHDKYISKYNF